MKVILVMVQSLNGKITQGDSPRVYEWTSPQDQKHFSSVVKENNLLVMGSHTYDAAKKMMTPMEGKLRLILTRDPEKYSRDEVPNQLEFSNKNPGDLTKDLENRGFSQMLLLGGGTINGLFFKENLVDELWLTIEPKVFGQGKNLAGEDDFKVSLELLSLEKLNAQGTILLKYKVLR